MASRHGWMKVNARAFSLCELGGGGSRITWCDSKDRHDISRYLNSHHSGSLNVEPVGY